MCKGKVGSVNVLVCPKVMNVTQRSALTEMPTEGNMLTGYLSLYCAGNPEAWVSRL